MAITVPALQSLWSDEDEAAGHHRRYRRRALDDFMSGHGFERVTSRYIFACLVAAGRGAPRRSLPTRPPARRVEQVIAADESQLAPSPTVDRVMRGVLNLERTAARKVRLPVGLSLMGVYRRG